MTPQQEAEFHVTLQSLKKIKISLYDTNKLILFWGGWGRPSWEQWWRRAGGSMSARLRNAEQCQNQRNCCLTPPPQGNRIVRVILIPWTLISPLCYTTHPQRTHNHLRGSKDAIFQTKQSLFQTLDCNKGRGGGGVKALVVIGGTTPTHENIQSTMTAELWPKRFIASVWLYCPVSGRDGWCGCKPQLMSHYPFIYTLSC